LENVNSRLASRIYEFSKRDKAELDNELLSRLAEFYINKEELTDDVKELFSPLYQYWDTHIIPQVTGILDNEKFSLPILCDELSFFSKFFSHCLQDSTLQDALL
jgi:predicted HAD superfamily phosphohydrolase